MSTIANPFEVDTEEEHKPKKYACTVVSLLPIPLHEEKPHILPFVFKIPAAGVEGISILHVEEGISYIPNPLIEEGRPGSTITQITMPSDMAKSIVDDYRSAHIALSEDAEPGIFWVEGRWEIEEVKRKFKKQIHDCSVKQKNWFRNLVAMADTDWQKNKNMLAVSDLQRHAARALGIKKDWVDPIDFETIRCQWCKASISPEAVKCTACGEIVNADAYRAMKLAQEKVIND